MRVVHVTDCYLPRVGGIELHVRDLADRQRRAGHEVYVLTGTPTDGDDAEPWTRRCHGRTTGEVSAVLTELDADVVHAHVSVWSPFTVMVAGRAARRGRAVVVTVHSMWSGYGPLPRAAGGLSGLGGRTVVWSAVSEAAAVPVRRTTGSPVHVLPNAIDPDDWYAGGAPRPTAGAPVTVVSVMRLTRTKRAEQLARMLCHVVEHSSARAVVVGDGPRRPAVEEILARRGVDDRVLLTGVLDRDRIRGLLHRSDVFVAPAHRESFGIAALEARAAGLPVVASRRSGVAEFIDHGTDGLLARNDRELARDVLRLVRDTRLRSELAAHNRAVAPRQDWDRAVSGADRLYRLALTADRVPGTLPARDPSTGMLR